MWQPIETAPKDGTTVDLWSGHHQRRWADCCWNDGKWWVYNNGYEPYEFDPTHWMPLPEPPQSK
jgi:hypothetical protein